MENYGLFQIPLTSLKDALAFTPARIKFSIRLCFAVPINKSQSQTWKTVGLDLRVPVFSHGQYVTLSRTMDVKILAELLPEGAAGKTADVVYSEVPEHMCRNQ